MDCIGSIYKQDYKSIEVIVVDNVSTDGTSEAVEKRFPKVKLVRNKKNLGVTGAVNRGLKYAKGRYLLLVDHDNILESNMLSELVRTIESDSKIGITVGKIYFDEDHTIIWAAGTGINLFTGQIYFRAGKDVGQFDKVEEVQVAPANFLLRRELVTNDGVYDPTYVINYEDTDLSFRIRSQGYRVVYTPKAISYHRIPMSSEGAGKRLLSRAYWIGRNRVIFMKRWGNFYPFVTFFLPLLSVYYLYLALRYNQLGNFIKYCKGIYDGVIFSERNKKIPSI